VNLVSGFYHYEGSHTTPPCFEGVQWFVARDPIAVSKSALSLYASFLNNSRPLQQLNGRSISVYTPGPQEDTIRKWIAVISFTGLGVLIVVVLGGLVRISYRYFYLRSRKDERELVGFIGSINAHDEL